MAVDGIGIAGDLIVVVDRHGLAEWRKPTIKP
jgi:hypothetical protein